MQKIGLQRWDPAQITKLSLVRLNLSEFHIGTLIFLEELDLSYNKISELIGSGIEQCINIVKCNLSHNQIVKKQQLKVFEYSFLFSLCDQNNAFFFFFSYLRFTRSLLELWMEGNCDGKATLEEYRSIIIYITRNLPGTNRSTGLIELDGNPISLEERITAITSLSKSKQDPQLYRWNLALMEYYGHRQVRSPDFLSNVKHLKLPHCNLSMVDLRGRFSIEVLDLSGNNLETVLGLNELPRFSSFDSKNIPFILLKRLRFLNLSGNSRLKLGEVLDSLKEDVVLEQVSFCVTEENHKHHPDNRKYRDKVLVALLMNNPDLRWIDNVN